MSQQTLGRAGLDSSSARTRRRLSSGAAPYLFLAPFLLSFVLFFIIPSVSSFGLSFFRYRGYGAATFVGWDNYSALFSSPSFWRSVGNTAFYLLVPMIPLLGAAMGLALLISSPLIRLGRIYKPLIFFPQMMAPVAASMVWVIMLSDTGVINSVLGLKISWLSDPAYNKWGVIILLLWRAIGWYFVVFLAALTSINQDVIEAAAIDGANAWQRFRYVILPLMRPIILFAVVVDTIGSVQLYTEPNLLLGAGSAGLSAPPSAAPVMSEVIEGIANGQFGLASATGWLIFVAVAILSFLQFRLLGERKR